LRSEEVKAIANAAIEAFTPQAHHEWLSWGGELLFTNLTLTVMAEEDEAVEHRQREEEEAAKAAHISIL
jgi:hypothetical protein